jgi:hypothetical protein
LCSTRFQAGIIGSTLSGTYANACRKENGTQNRHPVRETIHAQHQVCTLGSEVYIERGMLIAGGSFKSSAISVLEVTFEQPRSEAKKTRFAIREETRQRS